MTSPFVEGEDFYLEGAALVFTTRYHLRRGYCCESGCRHCPYRKTGAIVEDTNFERPRESKFGESGIEYEDER